MVDNFYEGFYSWYFILFWRCILEVDLIYRLLFLNIYILFIEFSLSILSIVYTCF